MKFVSFQDSVTIILKLEPRTTLFIVSCTKEKIWDENNEIPSYIDAKDAYTGIQFKKFLKWYQINEFKKLGYLWVILSGKYGFIEPDHPIGWYDINMDNSKHYPISTKTLKNQVKQMRRWKKEQDFLEVRLREFDTIICVNCSNYYLNRLRKCFRNHIFLKIDDFNSIKSV